MEALSRIQAWTVPLLTVSRSTSEQYEGVAGEAIKVEAEAFFFSWRGGCNFGIFVQLRWVILDVCARKPTLQAKAYPFRLVAVVVNHRLNHNPHLDQGGTRRTKIVSTFVGRGMLSGPDRRSLKRDYFEGRCAPHLVRLGSMKHQC